MKAFLVFLLSCPSVLHGAQPVLIVADEMPAMQVLARRLQAAEEIESKIVTQGELPADLSPFPAVLVYIHKDIASGPEKVLIEYAKAGGKLVLLHHSISSGKRKNEHWFPFLGIELPMGDVSEGGYKYYDPVMVEVVQLDAKDYITTHNVQWDAKTGYTSSDSGGMEKMYPAIRMPDTEVYLNHKLTSPKHLLAGIKYTDEKSGKVYMQDRAAWYEQAGKGWVCYFMVGHAAHDFENPAWGQMIVNAVKVKLRP